MGLFNSDTYIMMTGREDVAEMLKTVFIENGLALAGPPELRDPDTIRHRTMSEGGTAFLRRAFLDHIREEGIPALVVMDLRIPSGLGEVEDPEALKILRSILVSCILFSRTQGFEFFSASLLLIAPGNDPLAAMINRDPVTILDGLSTRDEDFNRYIDELRNDGKRFHSLFFVKILSTDRSQAEMEMDAAIFARGALARRKLKTGKMEKPAVTALDNGSDTPASLVISLKDGRITVDGAEVSPGDNDYGDLVPGIITVVGSWNHRTQGTVARKLVDLLLKGIPGEMKFPADSPVRILADQRCTMDGSTAVSLAGLLVRDLAQYRKIRIMVNEKNAGLLRNAQGYSMIREYLRLVE